MATHFSENVLGLSCLSSVSPSAPKGHSGEDDGTAIRGATGNGIEFAKRRMKEAVSQALGEGTAAFLHSGKPICG
jgi:hypothetical protein